ncbi:MAG: T9SS type A sorting domain-containing protein [bacterium]|nr:T9SS type A sorting domain-containing protein [bacterium]
MSLNYAGNPMSYKCAIFEGTDTILSRDFEVDTDYSLVYAGDMDYGDVDGDSINELVICGGRHIEVWESTGDNQFEMSWEYTDPTTYTIQSHIKCHDFNKNGVDEIIFSGAGITGECTRIFEMKRWTMEGETLVIGNSEEGDTIRKDFVVRNESDGELNIDSMIINSAYFGLTTMTWPLTINGNDSANVEIWFKGDSIGKYFDSMEVYADKSMYKEYLRAGNGLELRVDSIKAFDGMNPISGIDEDDIVVFYFDWGTNKPDINAGNIDSILSLSGGDEWDIAGEGIELTKWLSYPEGDRFYVYFDASGKIPTVKVGDTVYTDSQTVIGSWCGERWKNPVVITGSFGPTGTGERLELKEVTELQSIRVTGCNTIEWSTQTTQGTLTVYDISGREIIREESKASGTHKTDIRQLKNGIYFIKLHTENQSITEKMVRIK